MASLTSGTLAVRLDMTTFNLVCRFWPKIFMHQMPSFNGLPMIIFCRVTASALLMAIRQVGGTFGVAIVGAVLSAGYRNNLNLDEAAVTQ